MPIAPLPAATYEVSAVTDGLGVYLLLQLGRDLGTHLYRYDPATNEYRSLQAPPSDSDAPGLAYLEGQIYRVARFRLPPWGIQVDRYDLARDTWAPPGTVPGFPGQGNYERVIGYAGALYATAGGSSTTTYRYDPATNRWDDAAVADLPATQYTGAHGLVNGHWVLAGGVNNQGRTDGVIALDLAHPATAWVPLAPLPEPRAFLPGTGTGHALIVVGGQQDDPHTPFLTDTEVYTEPACPPCAGFSDVGPADYFYAAVGTLTAQGIVSGYGDCTFRPAAPTTRSQLAKLVVRAFEIPGLYTAGRADLPRRAGRKPVRGTGGSGRPCRPGEWLWRRHLPARGRRHARAGGQIGGAGGRLAAGATGGGHLPRCAARRSRLWVCGNGGVLRRDQRL